MFTAQLPYTPPSSPPSSPARCDSSPPSSPGRLVSSLLTESSPNSITDPFAASAKAVRGPPQYEKKRPAAIDDDVFQLDAPTKRPRYANLDIQDLTISIPQPAKFFAPPVHTSPSAKPEESEEAIWDEASTRVIDAVHGTVELNNANLTYIPDRFITDLEKYTPLSASGEPVTSETSSAARFFGPPVKAGGRILTRVVTAPVGSVDMFSRSPEHSRTKTGGLPREEIRLFLSGNQIAELPPKLMNLQKLTVLSLRANNLRRLPPEIANLKQLHTLNVANNKLEYLPSEILGMSLVSLQVHPNPFLPSPILPVPGIRPMSSTTSHLPRVLPLTELCIRTLFSPVYTRPSSRLATLIQARPRELPELCLLTSHYELPLLEADIPDSPPPLGKQRFIHRVPVHIKHLLHSYAPDSVVFDEDEVLLDLSHETTEQERSTSVGVCPAPHHKGGYGHHGGVFIRPAESRFTWEYEIAGQNMGGLVPLLWRGCSSGCLNFLDPEDEKRNSQDDKIRDKQGQGQGQGEDGDEMELSLGAIQFVEFGDGGFGEEDFEDE